MLNEQPQTYYVIKANGMIVSAKFNNPTVAQTELSKLPEPTKLIAEVVAVDEHGKELLFG